MLSVQIMAHCSGCGPLIVVQLDPISHSIQIVLRPEAGREVSISLSHDYVFYPSEYHINYLGQRCFNLIDGASSIFSKLMSKVDT